MLDRFVPAPRLIEIDHIDVAAAPEQAYALARRFDGARSPLVHALFALRTLPDRMRGQDAPPLRLRLDELGQDEAPGFHVLADQPGVGFAFGAIGKVWEPEIPFAAFTPDTFASFEEPGWAVIAWSVRCLPWGEGETRVVLELRLTATSEDAWDRLRRYYRLIGPFSHLIRRHMLALLRADLGPAEAAEQARALQGDEFIAAPKATTTDSIIIDAPPAQIWPWLVQLGCGRGGWYSYDLLDNGASPSARDVVPELQDLKVGAVLPATPQGEDGFTVLRVEAGRALVLGGRFDLEAGRSLPIDAPPPSHHWTVSWAFVLEPLNALSTRLLVRARVDFAPQQIERRVLWMRPVHHFMQAEQLRNLKRRAEGHLPHHEDGVKDVGEGILGAMGMVVNMITPFLRARRSHWGIDEGTAARAYPGDDLVPAPSWSWTHGVEIDAPPEAVWPWVAQIGQGKAGFYSYQFLENLAGCDVQNAEQVHAKWQTIAVGDPLRLHPTAPPLTVKAVAPGRWFVVAGLPPAGSQPGEEPRASWLFFIEPLEAGRTRFISRFRQATGAGWKAHLAYGPTLIEPIGFMMDRRMLLGVKERAERATTPPGGRR